MAQTGYTPILLYSSTTPSQAPAAGNLTNSTFGSELAINITDGKLFYKDNTNAVQVIAWKTTPTTAGGTGLTSYTAGDLPYYATGTTLSKLAIGLSGQILTSTGTAPQWTTLSGVAVTTFSAGTTGFTPSVATSGAVTLAGTLITTNGGTGLSSYTAGDLTYYTSGTALTKLAIGASGRWLGSSGTAPQWNAPAALTKTDDTNVTLTLGGSASTALLNAASLTLGWTGTLAVSRGGTGTGTAFTAGSVVFAGASGVYTQDNTNLFWDDTNNFLGIRTASPGASLQIGGGLSGSQATFVGSIQLNEATTSLQTVGGLEYKTSTFGSGYGWKISSIDSSGVQLVIGTRQNSATWTEVARFNSANDFSIANGNVVIATSGKGIDFSATPGTGTSELFDDYEEGTWTPTITNVTGTYTSTTVNYAQYTKIGEVVYGFLSVQVVTLGTASANMNFTLPFTPAREGYGSGRENVSTGDMLIPRIITGGSGEGRLYKTDGSAAGAAAGTYVVSFMYLT